jgi:2-polyprenyl-3-methyl-5-hydroxy-6-metoxy-1,4-benzoquinol methylase
MRLTASPQNLLEWLAVTTGIAPEPIAVGHFGYLASKFLLEAIDKNVLEVIGKKKVSLQHIATSTQLHEVALQKLLRVLASMGLVRYEGDAYSLTSKARKWLLKDSPSSLYWLLMFDNKVCFDWMQYLPEFLRTGKGLQYHDTLTTEQWFYYQQAMRSIARSASKEITRKIPNLSSPTNLLDIGGAHGLYAAAFCKKYPTLSATVFDLPAAVEQSSAMQNDTAIAGNIRYVAGDILTDDIGADQYDLILLASVAHHFTREQNIAVATKAFNAVKPGGYFTIMEVLTPAAVETNADMLGAVGDLFFALSSTSGTWSYADITEWLQQAGFIICKKASFLFIPGYVAITGRKPVK